MELTKDDLMVLIEAVEVWEYKDTNAAMTLSLLGIMMAKNKEDAKSRSEEALTEGKQASKEKKEIAICLKAKLVLVKNRLEESLKVSNVITKKVGER